MNVPNLEDLIGESEQDHVRVLEEEAREEHNRRAEESMRRYQERKGFEEYMREHLGKHWTGTAADDLRVSDHVLRNAPLRAAPINAKRLPGS